MLVCPWGRFVPSIPTPELTGIIYVSNNDCFPLKRSAHLLSRTVNNPTSSTPEYLSWSMTRGLDHPPGDFAEFGLMHLM